MDYQVFESLKKARQEVEKMRGWDSVKVTLLYYPDHPLATRKGNIITIQVDDHMFLRKDGYVR